MSAARELIRVSDWLAARLPPPPPELGDRLRRTAGANLVRGEELPDALLDYAIKILSSLGDDRTAATDLLTADALITYAIEAAVEENVDVADFAAKASRTIGELVTS